MMFKRPELSDWLHLRCDVASDGRDSRGSPSQRRGTDEGGADANCPRFVCIAYAIIYFLSLKVTLINT